MTRDLLDPKGLIRESFRIDGIAEPECRSVFLDWALSLPDGTDNQEALKHLITRYAQQPVDHPMMMVLREGLGQMAGPKRRGGWRARRGR
ncbi:hypothetical protein TG4357_02534 [Thalassovita gelatinovora]|uniref:Uncharacterized protein n=1 Tax=Thalassovita gelatinovora TaxID=53501 RepID=A0A0P1FF42_THAGE|nr:hypothetical protein [Thalassovita gelatinovora]QIZ79668.1 hypothetical protein HFZ77_03840 [Thalassovita gelatinovora]CUH66638.1 hypothetical protein TG4357_02534 [Thalassovita gelatinovora]SEQ39579.1 hypothetical protein SAMN04488043_10570 [Thalassovita gelatinovora]